MVERLGRLSDLELWRDIRASKIDGAHCCRRARVSQPNASGLRLKCRIFCGRLSRYNFKYFLEYRSEAIDRATTTGGQFVLPITCPAEINAKGTTRRSPAIFKA